ncbi:MAG: LytTR family DNA-binding domain-containing protein [Flavobacteriales bacterium]|jgi:two-component system LytT family response regulator|nr:LytTR family DNA-binding domain-containing protein [Flavobacteriales bacterium]
MVIKAIIIDDQIDAIESLKQDLMYLFPNDVQIVGESTEIDEGVLLFKEVKPNLIFLDIDLKKGTGFDYLKRIAAYDYTDYEVIFTTAFNQFAIKAIKFSAFDYLLKPIDPMDLKESIHRFKENQEKQQHYTQSNVDLLIDNANSVELMSKKLAIPTQDRIHFVFLKEIVYCESSQNYTQFFFNDGTKLMVAKTIKDYEILLETYSFIRCHQRYLVNAKHVTSFLKEDGGVLLMNNHKKIPVSRRKKEIVLQKLSEF